jgi:hypothetical protein
VSISDATLREIVEKGKAATEPPWERKEYEHGSGFGWICSDRRDVLSPYRDEELGENGVGLSEYRANLDLIVAACNHAVELAEEVMRLRKLHADEVTAVGLLSTIIEAIEINYDTHFDQIGVSPEWVESAYKLVRGDA